MSKRSVKHLQQSKVAENCNRREFLECSARNAAGIAAGTLSLGAARSPNERLQIGVIGLGSQGLELAKSVAKHQGADVVAICDVDVRVLAAAQYELGSLQRSQYKIGSLQRAQPVIIPQHEALLQRPDIDAVIIATPDHWHARMTADALQAQKDVFLETPVAHCIGDGELISKLAAESNRIVQVGLPHRSGTHFQSAVKLVRSGYIGKVHLAKAWATHRRKSIGKCATAKPPVGVDYQRWLGPAPARPFQQNRFHKNWSWFWDYGSGELGLWGIQHLDVIRWALDLKLPTRVFAKGGIHSLNDDRETPDTLSVHYDFPETEVIWEHRQWSNRGIEGRSSGAAFYGESGTLIVDRSGWKVYDHPDERFCDASEIKQSQIENFLTSVRNRTSPIADLHAGQDSSILCHLANIAFRLGRELEFDPQTRTFHNDSSANQFLLAQA